MIALCRYILQGGKQCEQAAIKGEYYCRHHQFVRKAVADATTQTDAYGARKPLPLVFPEDRAAVQINYFLVMQAINDGRLDHKTANLLIRILKACDANLKKGPLYGEDGDQGAGERAEAERDDQGSGARDGEGSVQDSAMNDEEGRNQEPGIGGREDSKEAASGTHVSESRQGAPAPVGGAAQVDWERRAQIVLKHQDKFLEIEKRYGNAPDYGARLSALADELVEKELVQKEAAA